MIKITANLTLNDDELQFSYMTSPGPGGQNVNKVATAVELRFNVLHSLSLPDDVRSRLIAIKRNKITRQGELIIKARRFRTQERNKQDALNRLITLLKFAAIPQKKRRKTRPTIASIEKRLSKKKVHARKKFLRKKN
jgi:ribosome-associated protein